MNIQILKKDSKKGFKKLAGINRDTSPGHIAKLKNSIDQLGMLQPIIVAEMAFITGKKEIYIIEGQHKYEACMALGIDIPYIIMKSISTYEDLINAMALLNSSSKSWTLMDYVTAWASLHTDYKNLMVYSNKYSVELVLTANILTEISTGSSKHIKNGKFKILNENENILIISQLSDVQKIIPPMSRANFKNFVSSYINMVRNLGEYYNHSVFLRFITKQKSEVLSNTNSVPETGAFLNAYAKFAVKSSTKGELISL